MFAESNKIKEGERVTFLSSTKRRVYGEVLKVNRVNMIICEDHEDMYKRKIWTVYKNYVRRIK
jgi:5-methylcytosine-specific restriction endonuclease McrA